MTKQEFALSLAQLVAASVITLVCIWCGYTLFRLHVEGGAYFLGLISASPVAGAAYMVGKSVGGKDRPATPSVQASVTTPDGQSVEAHTQDTSSN